MSNKGRKPILTPLETQRIIDQYMTAYEMTHKIKYADVHRYCTELYHSGQLNILPSESFWRKKDRMGRQLIDDANTALSHQISSSYTYNNASQLVAILRKENIAPPVLEVIENEINHNFDQMAHVNKQLEETQSKLNKVMKQKEDLQHLNKKQKDFIYQMYYYVLHKSSNENARIFDKALNNIFTDPLKFIEYIGPEEVANNQHNKVSDIFKNRLS